MAEDLVALEGFEFDAQERCMPRTVHLKALKVRQLTTTRAKLPWEDLESFNLIP
jgi:hypothetical protein